ncbi:MAG: aryl-sulfate sulfotransferase [Haloferacaceae archaeon]
MVRSKLALVLVVGTLLTAAVPGVAGTGAAADAETAACAGTIRTQPGGVTVVSVQGMRFSENESLQGKRPARLVAFYPNGSIAWVHRSAEAFGVFWSYDVDPLPNGNLFVTAAPPGETLLYELDPETGEAVWTETIDADDTHDADLLPNGNVVVANMRNYDAESDVNRDRVFVYNRTTDEVVWEWEFRRYFDRSGGGNYTEDWTHVNDVDVVGEDRLLLSPRNFDQVLLLNRTTGEVVWHLGEDDQYRTLKRQHNPDYLVSESGRTTVLVADSENNRIVEYARDPDGGWTRTWRLGGDRGILGGGASDLAWPRDADRLPNGNTLVSDSRNSRVFEVTPAGDVVWEVYAPWLVYDAARLPTGEHGGPTITDLNASGDVRLKNGDPPSADALERCAEAIRTHENRRWERAAANDSATANPGAGQDATGGNGTAEDTATTGGETTSGTTTSEETTAGTATTDRPAGGENGTTVTPVGFTALAAGVALLVGWWRFG